MPMLKVERDQAIDRTEFHRRLREWVDTTDEIQIGDETVKGVTPWIHVKDAGRLYKVHADTKRHGVNRYFEKIDLMGVDTGWSVIVNQRGNENKVVLESEKPIEGFYLYVVK